MNKTQTPLAKSIQRKKERIKVIEFTINKESNRFFRRYRIDYLNYEKQVLEHEITEEEKLLPEERYRMIKSYIDGRYRFGKNLNLQTSEQYFDANYTQETNVD